MSLLSLLGFGECKVKVLDFLDRDSQIIDLRLPEIFSRESLKGSINMDQYEVYLKIDEMKAFNKPLLICCRSGLRSDEVAAVLRNAGLEALNAGKYRRLKRILEENNV